MMKQIDKDSDPFPRPKFETKIIKKDWINCQVCLVGYVAKHQAEKISDKVNFKVYAEKCGGHKCG